MSGNFYTANAPLPPVETVCEVLQAKSAPTYEPHCLMTWAEMVAGMDDMAGITKETQQ